MPRFHEGRLRRSLLLAAAGLLATASLPGWAQSYPSRPLKLVIPFAAGGVVRPALPVGMLQESLRSHAASQGA